LLDDLLEHFRERGLVQARGKQRSDSPHIQAAARHLNRRECGDATMRYALQSLVARVPQWVQEHVPQDWYDRYGPRFDPYRFPKTDSARQRLILQMGQDGQQLLPWVQQFPLIAFAPVPLMATERTVSGFILQGLLCA